MCHQPLHLILKEQQPLIWGVVTSILYDGLSVLFSQLKPHFHLNWQFPKWNKRYSAAEPSSSGWQDVIHLMTANVRMKIMRWIFLTGKKKNYSVHFQCKTLTYTLIIQSKMCFVQFSPDDFWYGSGTPKTLTLGISWCKYIIYFVIELLCHQKSLLNDEDCK